MELIQGKQNKIAEIDRLQENCNMVLLWENYYRKTAKTLLATYHSVTDIPRDDIRKLCFIGVKYINLKNKLLNNLKRSEYKSELYTETDKTKQDAYAEMEALMILMGCLTPKDLLIAFPIDKTYDGEKYQCKDYFFTMSELEKLEMDKPLGSEKLKELLWDYENPLIRHFYVDFMCTISELYRLQTGKGLAEQWAEDNNIPTYSVDNEAGIIKNNQSGEIQKLSEKKSSHLEVVK